MNAQKTIVGLVEKDGVVIASLVQDNELRVPVIYKMEKASFDEALDLLGGGKNYAHVPTKKEEE